MRAHRYQLFTILHRWRDGKTRIAKKEGGQIRKRKTRQIHCKLSRLSLFATPVFPIMVTSHLNTATLAHNFHGNTGNVYFSGSELREISNYIGNMNNYVEHFHHNKSWAAAIAPKWKRFSLSAVVSQNGDITSKYSDCFTQLCVS